MKKIRLFLILATAFVLFSCDEDKITPIQPSDISNIRSEALPGAIKLMWDVPSDKNLEYVKISYFDHLIKKDVVRLASVYGDTILIPETRAKYGEYKFTLQPFSSTHTPGNIHQFTAVSGPAIATYVLTDEPLVEIPLTVAMLSTNAQEPYEGPIANAVDRNPGTFFHTLWSGAISVPHYFQVNLPEAQRAITFAYVGRQGNNNGDIKRVRIEASNDGVEWLDSKVQSFDPLPAGSGNTVTSDRILFNNEYKVFRFTPLARRNADPIPLNNTQGWFNFAEFYMYSAPYNILDPEAPAEGD